MRFAETLRSIRLAAGLTQAELGSAAGVARPNVAAYEAGRRQPLFDSAIELLEAAGARVVVEPPVVWTWTDGLRPYAVPSRLWRLAPDDALRSYEPGLTLWWSGTPRTFDLARRAARVSRPAAAVLAPYAAWTAFATALTVAIARRN